MAEELDPTNLYPCAVCGKPLEYEYDWLGGGIVISPCPEHLGASFGKDRP